MEVCGCYSRILVHVHRLYFWARLRSARGTSPDSKARAPTCESPLAAPRVEGARDRIAQVVHGPHARHGPTMTRVQPCHESTLVRLGMLDGHQEQHRSGTTGTSKVGSRCTPSPHTAGHSPSTPGQNSTVWLGGDGPRHQGRSSAEAVECVDAAVAKVGQPKVSYEPPSPDVHYTPARAAVCQPDAARPLVPRRSAQPFRHPARLTVSSSHDPSHTGIGRGPERRRRGAAACVRVP